MPLKYTLAELMGLADRLIGRGTSTLMADQPELKKDCLMAGRILAHLLLTEAIKPSIELE